MYSRQNPYFVLLVSSNFFRINFALSTASSLSCLIWDRAPAQACRFPDSKSLNNAGDVILLLHKLYISRSCHQNFQLFHEVLHDIVLASCFQTLLIGSLP